MQKLFQVGFQELPLYGLQNVIVGRMQGKKNEIGTQKQRQVFGVETNESIGPIHRAQAFADHKLVLLQHCSFILGKSIYMVQ